MAAQSTKDGDAVKNLSRGIVNKDGTVAEPCSLHWLHALALEVHRVRSFPVVKLVQQVNKKDQVRRLELVIGEIRRLLDYPQLFPNSRIRVRFLFLLGIDAELQFHQACADRLLKSQEQELERVSREKLTRPCYMPGSKGWENFLLNMAPGAPDIRHRKATSPKSSFQVIPGIGLRIIADLEREEREIVEFVQENCPEVVLKPAQTTLLVDLDGHESTSERMVTANLPHQTFLDSIQPNPYQNGESIEFDLPTTHDDDIRTFGRFINRLDYPPPLDPVVAVNGSLAFQMLSVRTWHPHAKPKEISSDSRHGS